VFIMTDFEPSGYSMKKNIFQLFMTVVKYLRFCNFQIQNKTLDMSYF